MQKKIIALAVAGLVSGGAFAQSNVTIYGTIDATYDNLSATGATTANTSLPNRGRTTMNSSFIGFKGSEALSGGTSVVFQVESGIGENGGSGNVGSATGAASVYGLANRDTYLGLSGGWGKLIAGVLSGPTRVVGAVMDVNKGATGIGNNGALLGKFGGGNGAGAFDQRISNAIAYISPTVSGLHGAIGYLPNENRGTDAAAQNTQANTTGWTLGLVYDLGPVFAGLTYTQLKDANGNSAGSVMVAPSGPFLGAPATKAANTRLAGKYNFGVGTVGLMWDRSVGDVSVGGGVQARQTVWYLPVTFKVGGGSIIAQYGKAANITGSVTDAVAVNKDYSAKHFELGYEYALSKRTTAKVLYSQITNGRDAQYDFLYGSSAATGNTTTAGAGVSAGADPRGFSIGLRHDF